MKESHMPAKGDVEGLHAWLGNLPSLEELRLHQFWAVTHSGSIYRIVNETWGLDWPLVERVFPVPDYSAGEPPLLLRDGHHVGITSILGINLVSVPEDTILDYVDIDCWGGHTSRIIGLFLDFDQAKDCLQADNRLFWDIRWRRQTQEVIDAIGNNHPLFKVSAFIDWSDGTRLSIR